MTKTNAMRLLDAAGIEYGTREYEYDESDLSGHHAAEVLGIPAEQVFKTLVTTGHSGKHYVFVIPADKELDLKKAALAVGEKSIAMLLQKELLPLTGYVHGGCSPVGMKKAFQTVLDETAESQPTIFVSAGKIGSQIELSPASLRQAVPYTLAPLTRSEG